MAHLKEVLLAQLALKLDNVYHPESSQWLIDLMRRFLSVVPARELLVMLFIYLPQMTYKAYNDVKYRHPKLSTWAARYGIQATWHPYAKGPAGTHELHIQFQDTWSMPAMFALYPQTTDRYADHCCNPNATQSAATPRDAVLLHC